MAAPAGRVEERGCMTFLFGLGSGIARLLNRNIYIKYNMFIRETYRKALVLTYTIRLLLPLLLFVAFHRVPKNHIGNHIGGFYPYSIAFGKYSFRISLP
jgi:hypothetical protein